MTTLIPIRHQAVVGEGGGKNQSVGKVQAKFFECPFVGQQVRVGKVMHASIIGQQLLGQGGW